MDGSSSPHNGDVFSETTHDINVETKCDTAEKCTHAHRIRIGSELVVESTFFDPLADSLKVIVAEAIQKHLEDRLEKQQQEQNELTTRLEALSGALSQSIDKISGLTVLPGVEKREARGQLTVTDSLRGAISDGSIGASIVDVTEEPKRTRLFERRAERAESNKSSKSAISVRPWLRRGQSGSIWSETASEKNAVTDVTSKVSGGAGSTRKPRRESVFDAVDLSTVTRFADSVQCQKSANQKRISNKSHESFSSIIDNIVSISSLGVDQADSSRRSGTFIDFQESEESDDENYFQIGSMTSSRKTGGFNMEDLRAKKELQILGRDSHIAQSNPLTDSMRLAAAVTDEESDIGWVLLHSLPQFVLRFSGVLPFDSAGFFPKLYLVIVSIVVLAVIVLSAALAIDDANSQGCMHLVTACLAGGCLYSVVALRHRGMFDLVGNGKALEMYAFNYGFLHDWEGKSAWHSGVILLIFLLMVVSRSLATWWYGWLNDVNGTTDCLSLTMYVITSGTFASLAYCQVYIATGLELMVESWCFRFDDHREVFQGMTQWNTLQAFLRRTAFVIEPCIVSLQTSLLTACVLTGVELLDKNGIFVSTDAGALFWGLSVLLPVAMQLYALSHACAVTEKCYRVPSLLNTLAVDKQIDKQMSHNEYVQLAQYIKNSAAGFYVMNLRITSFMIMKSVYILGAVVFTLIWQRQQKFV